MKDIEPEDFSLTRVLLYASFASFAGLVGHVLRQMEAGKPVLYYRAIFEGFASGFVGVIMMFACEALNLQPSWTGVIVGVSGWLGATATIQILEKLVRKKLGLNDATHVD